MVNNPIQELPDGPEGMDINPYLELWGTLEPNRCKRLEADIWQLQFESEETITCDVVSFQGAGAVEDLLKETIDARAGWSYNLAFDRDMEIFRASVTSTSSTHAGLLSLNPSIALLTAYLNALRNS